MPPKKKAADDGTGNIVVKKAQVARKKAVVGGEGEIVEKKAQVARKPKVKAAEPEGKDAAVEFTEVKIEGEDEGKKPQASQVKKTVLTMEQIAEKGRGLVPGVTETIAPVKLGILNSQETEDESGVAKYNNDEDEDTDDDEEDNTCYICMCEPCQWLMYEEEVVRHMREVDTKLFSQFRDVNVRNGKVRNAGYVFFNQLAARSSQRKRLPSCVEKGICAAYPSAEYTGFKDK